MTREQLIAAMSDAFQSAPHGASRWGAVADLVEPFITGGLAAEGLRGALDGIAGSIEATLAHEVMANCDPVACRIFADLAASARKAAGPVTP